MRIRVRIDPDCEQTLWGLAAYVEDAAFLVAFATLIVGAFVLMS